jgi:hypothetical protein
MLRRCKKCGKDKVIDDFPKYRAKGISGHRHTCKECWNLTWIPVVIGHNKGYYDTNKNGYRDRAKKRTHDWHKENSQKHNQHNEEYFLRHPDRNRAKVIVMMAVRSGTLKVGVCEKCGVKAHAHHDDYLKPLEVRWLCPVHHGERHRYKNRTGEWPRELQIRESPNA